MNKPRIGLSTLYCLDLPFEEMIEYLPKAGTPYIELVDDGLHTLNSERVKVLNDISSSYDLQYTVHAPFADMNIASPSEVILNPVLKRLKKSILYASDLNCRTWVFHPGLKTGLSSFYPGQDWSENMKSIHFLCNFAENHGVSAAIENMPENIPFLLKSVEDFKEFYRQGGENIGLVLDIGHANLNNQIKDFLINFADRIVHIHAHDNKGESDQHLEIGGGNVDWKKIARPLKKISYAHTISVESVNNVQQSISTLRNLLD